MGSNDRSLVLRDLLDRDLEELLSKLEAQVLCGRATLDEYGDLARVQLEIAERAARAQR